MRIVTLSVLLAVLALSGLTPALADEETPAREKSAVSPETEIERISYAIGIQLGSTLVQNEIEIDANTVIAGIEDMLKDRELAMDEEAVEEAMMALQRKMQAAREEMMREMESAGEENLEKAIAFLAENAGRDGVKQTPSGLQYRVVEAGNGPKPEATARVRVHYRGTLMDGTQFDSSYDRGEPAVFGVNQVIQGWQEALQLMPVGAKYELFIHPDLAYGSQGNQRIPANSLLLFDVELLEIIE